MAQAGGINGWKWKVDTEAEFAYDSNIYKLSASQADSLDANTPADQTSGRYNDMESVGDIIITPEVKFTAEGAGLNGLDLEIEPSVSYEFYAQNSKKNHFELGLDVKQDLTKKDTLSFSVDYTPGVFSKNYLADAVDLDSSLNISDSERRYEAGVHDDIGFELAWRRKLVSNTGSVDKLYGELKAGYETNKYDAPFSHRDKDIYMVGVEVDVELENKVDLTFSYDFETIDVPVASEVLIRDEPDFGVDLNGDADAADNNVRIVSTVDRSRKDHTFGVEAGTKLDKDWYGTAMYQLRIQRYDSNESFDITRQDRTDVRHRIGVGVEREYSKNWTLALGWRWDHEDAGRDALAAVDPTESKSYDAHTLSAVISYSL